MAEQKNFKCETFIFLLVFIRQAEGEIISESVAFNVTENLKRHTYLLLGALEDALC